jgi:hypothetical protein
VSEKFLDDAEVGAAFEKMRCEGMPQAVRMSEESADGARVEATSAHRQEHRVVRSRRERRSAELEVPRDVERRLLPEWDDALLTALASHMHDLAVEVDVTEIEGDGLGAP